MNSLTQRWSAFAATADPDILMPVQLAYATGAHDALTVFAAVADNPTVRDEDLDGEMARLAAEIQQLMIASAPLPHPLPQRRIDDERCEHECERSHFSAASCRALISAVANGRPAPEAVGLSIFATLCATIPNQFALVCTLRALQAICRTAKTTNPVAQ